MNFCSLRTIWGFVLDFKQFKRRNQPCSRIDVLWIAAGRNAIEGLFEVEHSTSIYSGLLRFNDVLLTDPSATRFYIVSNEKRRDRFSRQAYRPTFRQSGLSERASFLEYANVFDWHQRLLQGTSHEKNTE